MSRKVSFHSTWLLSSLVTLFTTGIFAQTPAIINNPGFENFIAETDSFPGWTYEKDSTGGAQFIVSQETDSTHTGNGALKIVITAAVEDSADCIISVPVQSLPDNKTVTITAWVKYAGLPAYYTSMFSLQQATMIPPEYNWIDRDWLTLWGNDPGTSDWKQISMDSVTADSANIFNLIIRVGVAGTFWVDDVEVTFSDIVPVTQNAIESTPRQSIVGNRIDFVHPTRYTLEAYDITGKTLLRKSGIATTLDLESATTGSGAYLYRVATAKKTYTKRSVVVK